MPRSLVTTATAVAALAVGTVLVTVPPADAATTIGQTFASVDPGSCGGGGQTPEAFQTARADGTSYATPSAGVLTSWSFMGTSAATTLTMRVFRLVTAPDKYTVVADAGPQQTIPAMSGLHTYPTRIPVHAGDIIGISSSGGACIAVGGPGDTGRYRNVLGSLTPVGGTASYGSNPGPVKYDIAANLEPDADGDGFGDETQDLCPQSAVAALTACPAPDTTVTKHPKHAVIRVKIKFVSSVAGSTFRCRLDHRKFKPCTSPLVYACPDPGTHHVKVLATAPYGLVEAKPAKVAFHVLAHRKGC
jgi:hypothetical protein